jgi:hypothetical protein
VYSRSRLFLLYSQKFLPADQLIECLLCVDYFRDACDCTVGQSVPGCDSTVENELVCGAAVVLYTVGNGAYVVTSQRVPRAAASNVSNQLVSSSCCLIHVNCDSKELFFSWLNIRSLHNKLNDFLELHRGCSLEMFCFSETWHDADAVCVRHLRASCFQIVDRPHSRLSLEIGTLSTNHGGVLVSAVPGVRLSSIASVAAATSAVSTYETACVRASTASYNCVILAVYRPGSETVTALFFDEVADVLDRIATVREQIFVAGDINIRLDRPDDPNACRLFDIFDCRGFALHVAGEPTHDLGGTIHVVASRPSCDAATVACVPVVSVLDSGPSDQRLLRWSVAAGTPPCPPKRKTCGAWRRLLVDDFIREVQASAPCQSDF